jgi:hypothetical protein
MALLKDGFERTGTRWDKSRLFFGLAERRHG